MRPTERIESLASRPWVVFLVATVLTLVLYWRALWTGFLGEDFMFLQGLEHPDRFIMSRGFWGQPLDRLPGFSSLWWLEPGAKGFFAGDLEGLFCRVVALEECRNDVAPHGDADGFAERPRPDLGTVQLDQRAARRHLQH
jgi:hypothetical protein